MLWMPETLKALRDSLDGMIEAVGEDAPIGIQVTDRWFDWGIYASLVYLSRKTGEIVGTEGQDHQFDPETEIKAIAF